MICKKAIYASRDNDIVVSIQYSSFYGWISHSIEIATDSTTYISKLYFRFKDMLRIPKIISLPVEQQNNEKILQKGHKVTTRSRVEKVFI